MQEKQVGPGWKRNWQKSVEFRRHKDRAGGGDRLNAASPLDQPSSDGKHVIAAESHLSTHRSKRNLKNKTGQNLGQRSVLLSPLAELAEE